MIHSSEGHPVLLHTRSLVSQNLTAGKNWRRASHLLLLVCGPVVICPNDGVHYRDRNNNRGDDYHNNQQRDKPPRAEPGSFGRSGGRLRLGRCTMRGEVVARVQQEGAVDIFFFLRGSSTSRDLGVDES